MFKRGRPSFAAIAAGQELPAMRQTLRPRSARCAPAVVSLTTLSWLVSTAQGTPAGAAAHGPGRVPAHAAAHRPERTPARAATASLSSPSDPGASDITNLGSGGWEVQSSAVATQTG